MLINNNMFLNYSYYKSQKHLVRIIVEVSSYSNMIWSNNNG